MKDGEPVAWSQEADQQTVATVSIVFSCTNKFLYSDICSSEVTVETDYKPQQTIFEKPLISAPLRLRKMTMQLQAIMRQLFTCTLTCLFQYIIPPQEDEYKVMKVLPIKPLEIDELKHGRTTDPVLQKLTQVTQNGWSE